MQRRNTDWHLYLKSRLILNILFQPHSHTTRMTYGQRLPQGTSVHQRGLSRKLIKYMYCEVNMVPVQIDYISTRGSQGKPTNSYVVCSSYTISWKQISHGRVSRLCSLCHYVCSRYNILLLRSNVTICIHRTLHLQPNSHTNYCLIH